MILPGGFSPLNALKEVSDTVNPLNGDTNYDVFSGYDSGNNNQVLGSSTTSPYQGAAYYDSATGKMMEWTGSGYQPASASTGNETPTYSQYSTKTGPTAEQIAQQKQNAEWDRQINSINQNLGVYAPRLASGLSDIDTRFNTSKTRLGDQRTAANTGYDDQNNLALQGRTRGYEQVDNYANKSANSLARVFQGANAGNSSVARLLAPKLVGQASDSRRMDVTETANQNIGGIKKARDEANSQFDFAVEDNENNRGYEREAFEKGILNEEVGQYNERGRIEREAGRDSSDSQANVDRRMGRLGELFGAGRFNPQYQAKVVTPQAVSLNDYKVDPMAIKLGQQQQGGSFYAPQLKKKQELRVR